MQARLSKAAVLAVLCTSAVFAQRRLGMQDNNARTPPDPATMIARHVDHLKTLLNLTDAQVTQATTIFTNAQTAVTPLRDNLSTAHTALQTAVKSNDSAAIDQQSAAIGSLTGQITSNESKAEAAFYAILTPDQQTKFNALGGRGFGGPGFGGPGFGGPGRMGMMGPGGPPPGR